MKRAELMDIFPALSKRIMEHLYHVYQIDFLTKMKFAGNPAGVVANADGLTDQQMQRIARELNNSETAFLFKLEDGTCDMQVRFFTPIKELPHLWSCYNCRALFKNATARFAEKAIMRIN